MPRAAVACAAAGAYAAHEQNKAMARKSAPAAKRESSLEQLAREHRARMEATHAETMWHAKAVTFLLGAFVLTVGLMVAGVL